MTKDECKLQFLSAIPAKLVCVRQKAIAATAGSSAAPRSRHAGPLAISDLPTLKKIASLA